jgi:hypothetical protein
MNARDRFDKLMRRAILLVGIAIALGACAGQQGPPATRLPTPTPPIRHRDAYPLLLTANDLGGSYALVEMHRLERGIGWSPEITRLSGYRHVYEGGGRFPHVVSQVECYLSAKEAQTAYRLYKEQLVSDLQSDERYAAVNESQADGLGEWGAMFSMRGKNDANLETAAFLFVRENVLVEVTLSGRHASDFFDQAIRQAKIVDQRILAR